MKANAELEEIKTTERQIFVEHQEDAVRAALCVQFLRQAAANLVEDQANQRSPR